VISSALLQGFVFAGGIDVSGCTGGDLNDNWDLSMGTEVRNEQWGNSIEKHPYKIYNLSNSLSRKETGFKSPRSSYSVHNNIGSGSNLNRTDCEKTDEVCLNSSPGILDSSKELVRYVSIDEEQTVVSGNQDQTNLKTQETGSVSSYVFVRNADKNHTELSRKNDVNNERGLGKLPEPSIQFSSVVSELGCPEIQDEVDEEGVLEKRVDHCGEFTGRRVIPVSTDILETEKHLEMTLGAEFKSLSSFKTVPSTSSEWTALITLWQTIGSRSLGKQGGCVKLGKENGESTHTPEEDVSDESPSLCCDSVFDVATGSSA